jgi:hypothetical protein
MKNYVHLKDGVVFAHHKTENFVDGSSDNVIEVDGELDFYLNKKYENGQFVDSDIIRYAILDKKNNNTVISIEKTYFLSDAGENPIINNPDVELLWTWDGVKFNPPVKISAVQEIIAPPLQPILSDPLPPIHQIQETTTPQV